MNNQIEFEFGEFLYLATDIDQLRRVCTGIQMRPHGNLYILSLEGQETYHYEFEITREPNVMITSTN